MGKKGECFFKIDWTFPGHKSGPKITTRHLLTTELTSPDLSFSGGLDWARKLLEHVNSAPPAIHPVMHAGSHVLPALAFPLARQSPEPWTVKGNEDDDDHNSVYSEVPSDCTTATTTTTSSRSGTIAAIRTTKLIKGHDPNNGNCGGGINGDDHAPSNPLTPNQTKAEMETIESLKEQRKQAEALYARNGDMSKMMALLARARNIPAAWEPNGRARF